MERASSTGKIYALLISFSLVSRRTMLFSRRILRPLVAVLHNPNENISSRHFATQIIYIQSTNTPLSSAYYPKIKILFRNPLFSLPPLVFSPSTQTDNEKCCVRFECGCIAFPFKNCQRCCRLEGGLSFQLTFEMWVIHTTCKV